MVALSVFVGFGVLVWLVSVIVFLSLLYAFGEHQHAVSSEHLNI